MNSEEKAATILSVVAVLSFASALVALYCYPEKKKHEAPILPAVQKEADKSAPSGDSTRPDEKD